MSDVFYHDTPLPGERVSKLTASAFAGESEPVTWAVVPLRDLGRVEVTSSDLAGPAGARFRPRPSRGLRAVPPVAVTMEAASTRLPHG